MAAGLAPVLQACGTDEAEETSRLTADEMTEVAQRREEVAQTQTAEASTPALKATPQATPGATPVQATSEGGEETGGETHVVEMTDDLVFDPEQLTLKAGDTVVWRTVGAVPHTSTCDPEKAQNPEEHVALPDGAETWDSGTVGSGEEYERTFDVPGDYTYFCIPHEANGMVGYLTVEE